MFYNISLHLSLGNVKYILQNGEFRKGDINLIGSRQWLVLMMASQLYLNI